MLKQPLLSRFLKAQPQSSERPSESLPESKTENTVKSRDPKQALQLEEKGWSPGAAAYKDPLPSLSESDADQSTAAGDAQAKSQKPRKQMSAATIGALAVSLSVLAAMGGAAFVRFAPTRLQATLMPNRAAPRPAPLRAEGDPQAEALLSSGDLFLTHQIFYRKLEALTGAPIASPEAVPLESDTATTLDKKDASANSSQSAPDSTKTADNSTPSQLQSERVVAAAPPAPQAAPVDFSGTTIDSVLEMRVAVAKDVSAIGFATSSSGVITDLDGNALQSLSPETASLAEISNGIVVDGATMPTAFWVYPEDGGYVAVGDRWYRGRVLIALRERGLIAVNYVLLGDYLYSVVGSEMSPGWAIESLKAQAVAARSYALTHNIHPASESYFDLDNTQRFQAYKGIGREANTTQAAVQATAGEFISYEGGIVESLYAASQAIVDDAHSGSGMSQLGAKDLAEQGYSYQEILVHYYPGTALGRLETDPE